jgi:arylsulfatase A-like enzyme
MMHRVEARSGQPVLLLLLAVLIGFWGADMISVALRAPSLLRPAHWGGLLALVLSGAVLYLTWGFLFAGFYLFAWLVNRILRLRLQTRALAVFTFLGLPLTLALQQSLQERILGMYISLRSGFFYVPTAITLAIVVVALVLVGLIARRLSLGSHILGRAFAWPGLILTSMAIFALYAVIWGPTLNVLSVFDPEQQREPTMQHAPSTDAVAPAGAPNLLMLVIEAFRYDEFSPETTPFLWRLAQENIWFTRYHVVASATRPSVTSFFTSLYPAQHGCYNLALGQTGTGGPQTTTKVAETIEAFPRLFQDHGYRTSMVTSNGLTADRVFGFEEVFRRFDAKEPHRFRVPSLEALVGFHFLKKNLRLWRLFKIIFFAPDHSPTYFEAPRVNLTALRQLIPAGDVRPILCYVHYMEPHSPYYRHPYQPVQINIYAPSRRESLLEAYRSELRAVDAAIADLYAELTRRGVLENTWVFITADHGEEFYDHRNWGHGKSLYPEVVHVPAILVPPAGRPIQRRVDRIAESIDISATFAELAGLPAPDTWEGRSLVPTFLPAAAVEGDAPAPAAVAFSQFDDGRVYWASAVRDGWQVLFRTRGDRRRIMLFHLDADPLAQEDLAGRNLPIEGELVNLLDEDLRRLESTAHLFRGEEEAIDPQQLEQLRALGYVD